MSLMQWESGIWAFVIQIIFQLGEDLTASLVCGNSQLIIGQGKDRG